MLIAHIIFALSSLPLMLAAAANEFVLFAKNKKTLPVASGISFVGMVSTGTVLVISSHQGLVGPCIEGLAYLGAISAVYALARFLSYKKASSEQ